MVAKLLKKGYKQSEIGVIPEEWEITTLEDVTLAMIQGVNTAIDKPEYVEEGIPMLKANNIIDGKVNFENSDHISYGTFQRYSDNYKLKKGDFLFSNIGARLGTGSLLNADVKCSFAWNVMRIIPNTKKVIPEFFCCLMNSPHIFQQIKSNETGSGMGFVPKNMLKNIVFAFPPNLKEQTAIAEVFSDIDDLIYSLDKIIEKKKNVKQGVMQQLFSDKEGLTGNHTIWKEEELDALVNPSSPICYGVLKPGEEDPTGVPLIRIVDFQNNQIDTKKLFFISKELDNEFRRSKLIGGDLLISIQGTIGLVALVPTRLKGANISRTVGRIRIKKANPEYVRHFLLSRIGQKRIKKRTMGTTRDSLNISSLRKIKITLPNNKSEQKAISQVLSDIDSEIIELKGKMAKYKKIKRGIMQQLMTGRIRLKWKS